MLLLSFLGSRGVTFAEMAPPPQLTLTEHSLSLQVSNSREHSSLVITKIEFSRDEDCVILKGWQKLAPVSKHDGHFEEPFENLDLTYETASQVKYYWEDPNGNRTQIELEPQTAAPEE